VATPELGFRSVLRNRQYLLFLASSNSATVGYSVYAISIVWLTYSVSRSFVDVGAVLFVELAAYAGTFLIGPVVDRISNQRTIYLLCYPVQTAAAVAIGVAGADRFLTVPLLLALVVVISILWDLTWAAYNAAPGILLTPGEQFAAGGVASAVGGANTVAGYAVGGVLILVVGAEGGMFLYGGLLALAALLSVGLRIHPGSAAGTGFLQSFREGWATLAAGAGRPLLQLASVDAVYGFFSSAPALFITVLSVSVFAVSTTAYGVFFTVYVVGGVAAGLVLGRLNPRRRAGAVLVVALLLGGTSFALAASLPPVLALVGAAWLAIGFFVSAYADAKYAFLRGSVEPRQLGRVTANLYLFPGVSSSAGALILSSLAGALSPVDFGLLIAAGLLGAGVLALVLPGVKMLRY
jgi:hypothetical protein